MNWSTVSRNVGYALLVDALFMLISIVIAIFDPADTALGPLAISFLLTFIVGAFPFIFVKKTAAISLREGYVIIFFSWVLSFIFGMLPYALWGGPFTVINAWFESVSGFTTTGSSILSEVESLPKALLFWRSSTHFIGGLGVVVFLLLLIPGASQMKLRLTNLELSSLSKQDYQTRANQTVYVFTYVYLGIFVACFVSYLLAGMSPFDAVNHAFSVSATGGFSSRDLSIASFNSVPISIITMVFMFLSSIHFGIIWLTIVRRSLKPLKNEVLAFYAGFLVIFTVLSAFSLKIHGVCDTWGKAFLDGGFQILSYASTTGLATADNAAFPTFVVMLMMIGGTICGMAGSTTGGLKSDRVLLLAKGVRARMHSALHPNSVTEIKISGRNIGTEDIYPHAIYIGLFFLIWTISLILTALSGVDGHQAMMATLSSITNVGPAVGELGTFGNFGAQPALAKFIYTVDMFLGRVEIYPMLAVSSLLFAKERRR